MIQLLGMLSDCAYSCGQIEWSDFGGVNEWVWIKNESNCIKNRNALVISVYTAAVYDVGRHNMGVCYEESGNLYGVHNAWTVVSVNIVAALLPSLYVTVWVASCKLMICQCKGHRRSGSYGNAVVTTTTCASVSTTTRVGVVPLIMTASGSLENVSLLSQNHNVIPTTRSVSWTPNIYHQGICEGRSINKLQNGAIPSVLKIGKIRNIRFVGNLILNIQTTFLDDDIIIVTSSDNRTHSICVLFSPSVYYRNSQVINSIWTTEEKRKSLTC